MTAELDIFQQQGGREGEGKLIGKTRCEGWGRRGWQIDKTSQKVLRKKTAIKLLS